MCGTVLSGCDSEDTARILYPCGTRQELPIRFRSFSIFCLRSIASVSGNIIKVFKVPKVLKVVKVVKDFMSLMSLSLENTDALQSAVEPTAGTAPHD